MYIKNILACMYTPEYSIQCKGKGQPDRSTPSVPSSLAIHALDPLDSFAHTCSL
jgi:hypothetical protein